MNIIILFCATWKPVGTLIRIQVIYGMLSVKLTRLIYLVPANLVFHCHRRENKLYCLFFSKYSTETSTQDKQLRSKHQEYILLEQEYEKEKRLKEAALIENK